MRGANAGGSIRWLVAAVVLSVAACATTPPIATRDEAVSLARSELAAAVPWANQAHFKVTQREREWYVLATCRKCNRPDGSRVSAAYLVHIDRHGRAKIVLRREH